MKRKPKLTMEYIKENKLSAIGAVKYFKPKWTDEECDTYLWECTPFPFSLEALITTLNKNFR